MAMFKRMFLFIAVNLFVFLTISITVSIISQVFGIQFGVSTYGIDYQSLFLFCMIIGFTGAFVSLLLSRFMAKMMMGVKVIEAGKASGQERELFNLVATLADRAGLPKTPEVGIYEGMEINAFATGPSKSRALVAVSRGLLNAMDSTAVEGVIGHEIAHIANGDMVTMTLLQGVINTFVLFFSKIAAWALSNYIRGNDREERGSPWVYYISDIVFQIIFSLLGSIVVAYFSRLREFRADRGGATFAGREKMIHALQSLKRGIPVDETHPALSTLKINGGRSKFLSLFSTHPDLDKRIEALRRAS